MFRNSTPLARRTWPLGLVLLTMLAALPSLADDMKGTPGFVDLDWIHIPDNAEEIQDINLDAVLVSLAADAKDKGDHALFQALGMIKSVRVKSFSLGDDDDKAVAKAVDKVADQLKKDDWNRLIYVKDDEETITVSTKSVNDDMVGLMLVTYEPGDAVAFINVVGDLDLAALLGLVGEFDGDNLQDMLEELDEIDGIDIDTD